jgi:hypothetical protein
LRVSVVVGIVMTSKASSSDEELLKACRRSLMKPPLRIGRSLMPSKYISEASVRTAVVVSDILVVN